MMTDKPSQLPLVDDHQLAASIDSDYIYSSEDEQYHNQQPDSQMDQTQIQTNITTVPSIVNSLPPEQSIQPSSDVMEIDSQNSDKQDNKLAISDDEESGGVDREYTGQFEGPEKTLEVCFCRRIPHVNAPSNSNNNNHNNSNNFGHPQNTIKTDGLQTLTKQD